MSEVRNDRIGNPLVIFRPVAGQHLGFVECGALWAAFKVVSLFNGEVSSQRVLK